MAVVVTENWGRKQNGCADSKKKMAKFKKPSDQSNARKFYKKIRLLTNKTGA